ncbi:unknown protein [Seminavis robusta]|uniref:Uncharacterized protein n=1 Tax=Seminavis robusta TaxID=568900 RepID=A0A9N8EMV2_9STRA|nr:unknown protein [Seminavis robusta]|eukprot:Sro1571_g283331.1  (254) ;mRNA; r:9971-10732
MGVHMDRWALFILSLLPRIRAVSLNFDDIPQERRQEAATNLTNAMSYLNTTRELSMTLHQATARDTLDVFLKAAFHPRGPRSLWRGIVRDQSREPFHFVERQPHPKLSIRLQKRFSASTNRSTKKEYIFDLSLRQQRYERQGSAASRICSQPFLQLLEEDHHTLCHLARYCVDMADKDTTQRKLDKIKFLIVLNCYHNRRALLFGPDATTKDWFRVIASPRGCDPLSVAFYYLSRNPTLILGGSIAPLDNKAT